MGAHPGSNIKKEESLGLKFSTRQASKILNRKKKSQLKFFCKLPVSQFSKYKQQKKVLRLKIQQAEKGLQFTEEEEYCH